VNEWTIGDAYSLLNVTDILNQLGKAKFFSTVDLALGYYQVELAEKDSVKIAFSTPMGHFEFLHLPMGLKSLSATFQSL
jgi:hypothetical protein